MGSYIPTIHVKADQITEATMRMLDGPGGSPQGQALALQHQIDASMRLIERFDDARRIGARGNERRRADPEDGLG
jgi:hypothetical protein